MAISACSPEKLIARLHFELSAISEVVVPELQIEDCYNSQAGFM